MVGNPLGTNIGPGSRERETDRGSGTVMGHGVGSDSPRGDSPVDALRGDRELQNDSDPSADLTRCPACGVSVSSQAPYKGVMFALAFRRTVRPADAAMITERWRQL